MTRLFFDMEQVAGLARHAREAPARRMTMAQRAAAYGEDRCATHQPGEERLAPPCLWLVKDEGIYLMSPGLDPDPDPDDPPRRPPVAYAEGFDPTRDGRMAVWDRARDAVGGDDFAEDIPIEWVDAALTARAPAFALEFGPDAIGLRNPSGDASTSAATRTSRSVEAPTCLPRIRGGTTPSRARVRGRGGAGRGLGTSTARRSPR